MNKNIKQNNDKFKTRADGSTKNYLKLYGIILYLYSMVSKMQQ